jgi:hypothetical protein
MTVTQQIEAAEQYSMLWRALMPESEAPGTDQFLLWAGQHPDAIASRGINRAAAKVRKMRDTPTPMTLDDAIRYAASVMKNESLGIRRHRVETRE